MSSYKDDVYYIPPQYNNYYEGGNYYYPQEEEQFAEPPMPPPYQASPYQADPFALYGQYSAMDAGLDYLPSLSSPASTPTVSAQTMAAPTAVASSTPLPSAASFPNYSPVPSLTEAELGFGAGTPQGPAIGSGADGGFINAPLESELGFGNSFGQALSSGGQALAPHMAWAGPLGMGAIGAYTADKGIKAWEAGKGEGGLGGLKAGIEAAGPLNFVPVLGQLPWIAGGLRGLFSDPVHKDERKRREGRGNLGALGIFNKNHNYINENDEVVDMDQVTAIGGGNKPYDIDWSAVGDDPEFGRDVGALNAFTSGAMLADSKLSSDLSGELANYGRATGSTRNVVSNVKNRIDQKARELNVDPWEVQYLATNKLAQDGKLSRDEADARLNELDFQYGKNAYARGGKAYGASSSNPSGEIRVPRKPGEEKPVEKRQAPAQKQAPVLVPRRRGYVRS